MKKVIVVLMLVIPFVFISCKKNENGYENEMYGIREGNNPSQEQGYGIPDSQTGERN